MPGYIVAQGQMPTLTRPSTLTVWYEDAVDGAAARQAVAERAELTGPLFSVPFDSAEASVAVDERTVSLTPIDVPPPIDDTQEA